MIVAPSTYAELLARVSFGLRCRSRSEFYRHRSRAGLAAAANVSAMRFSRSGVAALSSGGGPAQEGEGQRLRALFTNWLRPLHAFGRRQNPVRQRRDFAPSPYNLCCSSQRRPMPNCLRSFLSAPTGSLRARLSARGL
jgi:hypothetical protein